MKPVIEQFRLSEEVAILTVSVFVAGGVRASLCARKSDIPLICRILFWAVIVGPVVRTSVLSTHIDVVAYSFGHIMISMVAGAHICLTVTCRAFMA